MKEFSLFMSGVILFLCILFAGVNQMTLPGDLAQIEQLRKDVASVQVTSSEDVIGQVTQWNQQIASSKKYNAIWWADFFIPDDWDKVEMIPIPKSN